MKDLLRIENIKPTPRVDLRNPLPFRSFQAKFYPLDQFLRSDSRDTRLVKRYTDKHVYNGFFPFGDPRERLKIMKREVVGMETLGPDMSAEMIIAEFIGEDVSGDMSPGRDTVIAMYHAPLEDSIETRIARGNLPGDFAIQSAERIAAFHHDSPICTPLGIPLDTFYLRLMANEIQLLRYYHPDRFDEITNWYGKIVRYINTGDHREMLRVRSRLLGSPRDAHGDLKTDNMIMINGRLNIHDSVPAPLWRANDPLMDLYFLITDLEMKGQDNVAEEALQHYLRLSREYRENQLPRSTTNMERSLLSASDDLMTTLSRIYRFTIPFRLARIQNKDGVEVVNEKLAYEKLRLSYEGLN